jgi:hypothetical protein
MIPTFGDVQRRSATNCARAAATGHRERGDGA